MKVRWNAVCSDPRKQVHALGLVGRQYGSRYEWTYLLNYFQVLLFVPWLLNHQEATEEVDADEFKFQDVVENDPYWQWQDEYTVVPKNPTPEEWVSGGYLSNR